MTRGLKRRVGAVQKKLCFRDVDPGQYQEVIRQALTELSDEDLDLVPKVKEKQARAGDRIVFLTEEEDAALMRYGSAVNRAARRLTGGWFADGSAYSPGRTR